MNFRKLNKNCFTTAGDIDYPRIVLSYGSVAKVFFTSVRFDDDLTLHLTFDACLDSVGAKPTDEFYLFAYSLALCVGILFDPVPRSAGAITLQLPVPTQTIKHLPNQAVDIHRYAFLRSRRGNTSDTIYIPLMKKL